MLFRLGITKITKIKYFLILRFKELYKILSKPKLLQQSKLKKRKHFTFHFSSIAGWGLTHSSVISVDWESVALRLLGAFGTLSY